MRLTKVRQAKQQYTQAWSPATDFYKPLRDRIQVCAQHGWDMDELRKSLVDVTDPKKVAAFEACRKGLAKWSKKAPMPVRPFPNAQDFIWASGGLEIRINPELMAGSGTGRQIIKLYFKQDALSQQKARLVLYLLEQTLGTKGSAGVLDVRRAKYLTPGVSPVGMDALLAAEAVAFATLWHNLP